MDLYDIIDAFELIEGWDERFEMIADLGKGLVPPTPSERIDANLVPGCDTRTWLTGGLVPGTPAVIEFRVGAVELLAPGEGPRGRTAGQEGGGSGRCGGFRGK
jgi:cysteine desulfuration protein SufE